MNMGSRSVLIYFAIVNVLIIHSLVICEQKTDEECGVEASPNPIHRSPWLVLLELYQRGILLNLRCAGILINKSNVVTAAHCINSTRFQSIKVRLGDYNLETKVDCVDGVCADPYIKRKVDSVTIHPEYDGGEHDIAVLHLEKPAPYTDFIRPACLPNGNFNENTTFYASGWGEDASTSSYSAVKKFVELPNWPYDYCTKMYIYDVLPSNSICAGGLEGEDTCRGDSGGPLMSYKKKAELYGVISKGSVACGKLGVPGVYVNVLPHLEWIEEVCFGRIKKSVSDPIANAQLMIMIDRYVIYVVIMIYIIMF